MQQVEVMHTHTHIQTLCDSEIDTYSQQYNIQTAHLSCNTD